jgi:hypothetical protein
MDTIENKPVKRFQAGRITASVWRNIRKLESGEDATLFSVTLDKRYRDKDGNWQGSSFLHFNEIPRAVLVLNKAYEFLTMKDRSENEIQIEPPRAPANIT